MKLSRLLYILAVSLTLAAYSAWISSAREGQEAVRPAGGNRIPLVRTDEAEKLWHQPTTLFLDVRSSADYAHGHIAGAVHFAEEEFEQRFPELRSRLKRAQVLVVYCKSVDCGKSLWTSIRLRNEGLTQTKIYPAGWNEWQERGLPSGRGAGR